MAETLETQPDAERDHIKQRVAKLLAMTVDRGATEYEAIMAAERAAELMAHYDIGASELSIRSARAIKQSAIVRQYGKMNVAAPAARHIAQLCDCMYWLCTEIDPRDADLPATWQRQIRTVVFFGLPADAEIAAYLFELISSAIVAETDIYKASPSYQREVDAGVNGRVAITSFVDGMEKAICARLDTMRDEKYQTVQRATGRSLVVTKEAKSKRILRPLGSDS